MLNMAGEWIKEAAQERIQDNQTYLTIGCRLGVSWIDLEVL